MPTKKKPKKIIRKVLCPAPSCKGGYLPKEAKNGQIEKVPSEVLARKKKDQLVYRCTYCGFMWAQRDEGNVTPLGFLENLEFKQVPKDYRNRGSL